jgi:AraC-like DNA-binding protein
MHEGLISHGDDSTFLYEVFATRRDGPTYERRSGLSLYPDLNLVTEGEMPSSTVRTFTDPDDYAAAIRQGTIELTVTRPGDFTAQLTRIDLHRLWMQRFSENLPRVSHVAGWGGRAVIAFQTHPGPTLLRGGVQMEPDNIVRHVEGQSYHQLSSGFASYGTMSLPVPDMVNLGASVAGCDLTSPKDVLTLTPPPAAMAKLLRLHAAGGQLAEDAPAVIAHPEAARGLEQALIEAMVACLDFGEVREDRSALRKHALILRRFHRAAEENPDRALYLPELCTAIGVSERTLRVCCQEQLGMSPSRYLLLRRMHLARRALRESAPITTTVTEIATQYGFWQFGRFAAEYKSLFGELPSAALRRPRE